ncbi:MAG: MFS transporter, partial [Tepidiformaceae bacterium]
MIEAPTPASINRPAMALSIALAFSQDAIYGLVFLSYMNHYLLDVLQTSPGLPGYTLALFGAIKLAIHPIAGRMLDRTSPRALFRTAVALQAGGLVLVLLVHALWSFLVATCLIAAGSATIWPLLYEVIARTQSPEVHSHATGILSFAGYIATGVGFALGVVAANFGPWRTAFFFTLALAVVPLAGQHMAALDGAPHQTRAKPTTTGLAPPTAAGQHHAPHQGLRARLQGAAFFAIIVFIDYAAVASLAGVYGPYVRRTLDITLLRTSLMLIPAAAVALIALLLASRYSRPERRLLEMALFFLISAAGALGLAVAPSPWLAAAAATLLGAGAGGVGPIVAAAMIEQGGGPAGRGLVIGTLMSIEGLGGVLGPALMAVAISVSGPRFGL